MGSFRDRLTNFLWSSKQFTITNLIILLVLILTIQTSIVSLHRITSASMENTLLVGDVVLVVKTWYGFRLPFTSKTLVSSHRIQPGDVVLFEYPYDPKQIFAKRCAATAGDTVSIIDKALYINGIVLPPPPDSKFADPDTIPASQGTRDQLKPTVIPRGTFFVLGDNRDFSSDSRMWGCVPEDRLIGKAAFILWSAEPGAPFAGLFGPHRKGRTWKRIE